MDRIILAYASPRRSEIMNQTGIRFEVIPSVGEEVITKTEPETEQNADEAIAEEE